MCSMHYTRIRRHGSLNASMVRGNDEERIRFNTVVDDNGCWNWRRYIHLGYGKTAYKGRMMQAHRFAWTVLRGPIPEGMQLNHTCHNRACVNPAHLYLGTQLENMEDMKRAGRSSMNRRRGERHVCAKLTEDQVRMILGSDETTASLARLHGVSESLVRAVRKRLIWRHVDVRAAEVQALQK